MVGFTASPICGRQLELLSNRRLLPRRVSFTISPNPIQNHPSQSIRPLFEPVDHVVNQCNRFPCLVCHVRGTDSRRLDSGLDMSTADGG